MADNNEIIKKLDNVEQSLLSIENDIKRMENNLGIIQKCMGRVLKENIHYGVIPGTKKPTLLKPGADVLVRLFNFSPSFAITKTDKAGGHREYEICASLTGPAGNFLGSADASCSTLEAKYRYRKGGIECPECGAKNVKKGSAQYGGGFYCSTRDGGCGAKFKDRDPRIDNQETGRVENPDPADLWNTVLKMAEKRALVAVVLMVTGASYLFTQDMEDLTDYTDSIIPPPPKPKSEPEPAPAPVADDNAIDDSLFDTLLTQTDLVKFKPHVKKFLEATAKGQMSSFNNIVNGSLSHQDSFKASFKKYYEANKAKAKPKAEAKVEPESAPAPAPEPEIVKTGLLPDPPQNPTPNTYKTPPEGPTLEDVKKAIQVHISHNKLDFDEIAAEFRPDKKINDWVERDWRQLASIHFGLTVKSDN
jgi:ssDNA-binding Zn-finger/Zn-ribbon topoisomerase 1